MIHEDDVCKLIEGLEQRFNTAQVQIDKITHVPRITDDIAESVFVFKNFAPRPSIEFITIILAYNPSDQTVPNKLWANIESNKLELINEKKPRLHLDYKQIEYEGVTYHPYSVKLSQYTLTPNHALEILLTFYEHCRFDDSR